MKSKVGLVLLLTTLGLLFLLHSPSADEKTEEAALSASNKWLGFVDKGDYSKSWERASLIFRSMETKTDWENKLNTYRTPLGKVSERNVRSKRSTTTIPNAPEREYVVIEYETVFKNKQTVTETVTAVLEKDGSWKVAGYYINFPRQEPQPPADQKKE